jgi:hypothetical protein
LYGTFYNPDYNRINEQDNAIQRTQDTFKAFVDAVIPRSPMLAKEFGEIQYFGALDFNTDEYLIMTLDHYYIPLAIPTAEMLDVVAEQLVFMGGNNRLFNYLRFPRGGIFAALSPEDRFRALTLLEQVDVNLADLPVPYLDNSGLVLSISSVLNRYTMMGYYSEWYGYGTTRLLSPNQRKLEFYPLSWSQVGYPGPSLGYRTLREA